jgi:hypothetical protein
MSEALYRIKMPALSGATDYAYLVNNNLGWVSSDFRVLGEDDIAADFDGIKGQGRIVDSL